MVGQTSPSRSSSISSINNQSQLHYRRDRVMAAEESNNTKWEGKAIVEIPGIGVEQAWSALEDFCNLHKWIPIDTCYQVEGVQGQPGLTRYCAANTTIKGDEDSEPSIKWAKEKLLIMDPVQRCLSYEIVDNNIGFKSYVATLKVVPINGDDGKPAGCKIEWGFVSDPVEGMTSEGLNSYIEYSLQFMAKKVEESAF